VLVLRLLLLGICAWSWYLSVTKTKRHERSAARALEQKNAFYAEAAIEADKRFEIELSLVEENKSVGYLINASKAHYVSVRNALSMSTKSTFRLGASDTPDQDWLRERVRAHASRINRSEIELGHYATNASLAILVAAHDRSLEISSYLLQRFPNNGNALHRSNNFHSYSQGMINSGIYTEHGAAKRIAGAYTAAYGQPEQIVLFEKASRSS
jgi:hypothetical protein